MLSRSCKGFTLIELMVAALLSIGLCCITLQLVLTTKKALMKQQALVRIYNNQLAFSWFLSQSVYQSGQLPCSSLHGQTHWQFETESSFNHLIAKDGLQLLKVSDLNSNPWFPSHWLLRMAPNQPVLWVTTTQKAYEIQRAYQVDQPLLQVQSGSSWPKDTWLVIDDGQVISLVQTTEERSCHEQYQSCVLSVKPFKQPLNHLYSIGSKVSVVQSLLYFVADTQRVNQDNQSITSLYVCDLNGHTQELIEGVEAWQVEKIFARKHSIGVNVSATFHSIEPAVAEAKHRESLRGRYVDRLLSRSKEYLWLTRTWA